MRIRWLVMICLVACGGSAAKSPFLESMPSKIQCNWSWPSPASDFTIDVVLYGPAENVRGTALTRFYGGPYSTFGSVVSGTESKLRWTNTNSGSSAEYTVSIIDATHIQLTDAGGGVPMTMVQR